MCSRQVRYHCAGEGNGNPSQVFLPRLNHAMYVNIRTSNNVKDARNGVSFGRDYHFSAGDT